MNIRLLPLLLVLCPVLAFASETASPEALFRKVDQTVEKFNPAVLVGDRLTQSYDKWGPQKEGVQVEVTRTDLGPSLNIQHTQKPDVPWDMQIVWVVNEPIRKGDTILVVYAARVLKSSGGTLGLYFDPGKWMRQKSTVGDQWLARAVAFRAPENSKPDKAPYLTLHAGHEPQTLELAHVRIYNFGQNVNPEDLPR